MPFFYLLWRTISGSDTPAGGIWALLLGSIVALVQFFLGALVEPGGFGFSRWVSGCIDIVALPVMAPIIIYLLLIGLKIVTGSADFASFALLWLIPGAAIRTVNWSSQSDPILLILVPVLWTAIAVGVSFFITIIQNNRSLLIILAFLAILIIPLMAACSYWAFYSQKSSLGFIFLIAAAAPMLVSVIQSFVQERGRS